MVAVLHGSRVIARDAEYVVIGFRVLRCVLSKHLYKFAYRPVTLLQLFHFYLLVLIVAGIIHGLHVDKAKVVAILILNHFLRRPCRFSLEIRVVVACHAADIVEQVHAEGAPHTSDNGRRGNHEGLQVMFLYEGWFVNSDPGASKSHHVGVGKALLLPLDVDRVSHEHASDLFAQHVNQFSCVDCIGVIGVCGLALYNQAVVLQRIVASDDVAEARSADFDTASVLCGILDLDRVLGIAWDWNTCQRITERDAPRRELSVDAALLHDSRLEIHVRKVALKGYVTNPDILARPNGFKDATSPIQ